MATKKKHHRKPVKLSPADGRLVRRALKLARANSGSTKKVRKPMKNRPAAKEISGMLRALRGGKASLARKHAEAAIDKLG